MKEKKYNKDRFGIRLGLLPTRRDNGLSHEVAIRQKNLTKDYILENHPEVELIDIDELNDEGMLYRSMDAEAAADLLMSRKVDAVFALHCNFGCEEGVARAAKRVGKPLLLWGPRDEGPDAEGFRDRDTQCGMFATSKALLRNGVQFNYITNSCLDSEEFKRGFEDFLAVAGIVKCVRSARIGQIGVRPMPFSSVMANEGELSEKFGVEIVPYSIAELAMSIDNVIKENDTEYRVALDELKSRFRFASSTKLGLEKSAGTIVAVRRWAKEQRLDAIAIQCWNAMQVATGIYPCVANAILTEQGLPMSCETDIHGAITMLMLDAASRGKTSVLADVTIRHPEDDNVELLWHCGNFPLSMSTGGNLITDKGRHPKGVACSFEMVGGDITVARFDGVRGHYSLLMGEAVGVTGPMNRGTYLWAKFNNWKEWENKLIYGPYIHHVGIVHGKYARVLLAACRYFPELEPDPVSPDIQELTRELLY